MIPTSSTIFPPLLARSSRRWRGRFPRQKADFQSFMIMKGCPFLINQQTREIQPANKGNTSRKNGLWQHQWRPEIMKEVAGPPHYPLVHGIFLHKKTVCGNNQPRPRLIEKMKQGRKRSIGLPWPPRSAPLKGNNHRSPALWWSLLILIMELRKHGLEVGESIYCNFLWSATTYKALICWKTMSKIVRSDFN